jgi:hypothetical protein
LLQTGGGPKTQPGFFSSDKTSMENRVDDLKSNIQERGGDKKAASEARHLLRPHNFGQII